MKSHGLLLFGTCALAFAQSPIRPTTITFNRFDSEHCRVQKSDDRLLMETEYQGTSVAVGLPENRGNGEFAVYVLVRQIATGTAKVNRKDFIARLSDRDHTVLSSFKNPSPDALSLSRESHTEEMRADLNPRQPGGPPSAESLDDNSYGLPRRTTGVDPNAQARQAEEHRQWLPSSQMSQEYRSREDEPGPLTRRGSFKGP
jgi:hypothetical protein